MFKLFKKPPMGKTFVWLCWFAFLWCFMLVAGLFFSWFGSRFLGLLGIFDYSAIYVHVNKGYLLFSWYLLAV